ncbi:MAG: protein translocase subunit SecF, partial [Burkholderiales bacterium]|nr:protein translocase subunit SecF [Burkholderiales bacterium]
MEFFRIRKDINFMKHALVFNVISAITFALAVIFLLTRGLHLSVEFTGGTSMEVQYTQAADLDKVRSLLEARGLKDATVQNFGTSDTVLIRMANRDGVSGAQLSEEVLATLK